MQKPKNPSFFNITKAHDKIKLMKTENIDEHFESGGKSTECKPDLSRGFQTGVRDPWGAARGSVENK